MTIERPMFPPRREAQPIASAPAGAPCTVLEFPSAAWMNIPPADRQMIGSYVVDAIKRRGEQTGHNERLRSSRKEVWNAVEARLNYWRAWRELHSKIRMALAHGVLHQVDCPAPIAEMNDFENPWVLDNKLLEQVMVAERELLLTPAPTVAMVNWKKKTAMRSAWYRIADGSIEREIVRAIDADESWLAAHPGRQCKPNMSRRSGPTG